VIIQTEDLRRDYLVGTRLRRRRVTAVADVTLTVAAGESVGFLGPNGAGKSTTIKMLTGVLVPTAGRATVCGLDPVRERRELAKRIGVVFGQRSQLWWDLPLADSFDLHAAIHRVPPARYRERLDECVELLDMAGFLGTPVRQLSLGQRMRGEVTAALLHSPRLLVLDEPTIGLDLASKERLRSFLSAVNARGDVTLLLTTHDLPDVERLCRRVVVIDQGRVLVDDDLATLRRRFAGNRALVIELAEPAPPLLGLDGVVDVAVEAQGLRQRLEFTPATTAAELIAAVAQRAELRDVAVDEPSIEDLVRTLYARR
jgi:ABC-2 type transport system ATP-binding protein